MRFCLIASMTLAANLLTVFAAFAQQCTGTATSADESSPGTVRLQAVTRQSSCPSGTITYAEAWIEGAGSIVCLSGDGGGAQACSNQGGGNTSVTVAAGGCGSWNGRSSHIIAPGGQSQVTIQTNRLTTLNAGSCIPDCQATHGPDYYWNGSECTNLPSPIIISTRRGNGTYRMTSAAGGVLFDIDGDGDLDQVAWTAPQSGIAFLARDSDGDGAITSGKELFGNYTVAGISNGFEALAYLAQQSNGGIVRGSVTEDDPLYGELLLWVDANHNGLSEASELEPLATELSAIGLGYNVTQRKDGHGNIFLFQGWARSRTGPGRNPPHSAADDSFRRRVIWDVFLTTQQ